MNDNQWDNDEDLPDTTSNNSSANYLGTLVILTVVILCGLAACWFGMSIGGFIAFIGTIALVIIGIGHHQQ